jgi:hypothetical protein
MWSSGQLPVPLSTTLWWYYRGQNQVVVMRRCIYLNRGFSYPEKSWAGRNEGKKRQPFQRCFIAFIVRVSVATTKLHTPLKNVRKSHKIQKGRASQVVTIWNTIIDKLTRSFWPENHLWWHRQRRQHPIPLKGEVMNSWAMKSSLASPKIQLL